VPKNAVIAPVDDVYNAVVFLGDYVGQVMIQGRGAGGNPTASAVVADLLDLANGRASSAFGRKTENLTIAAPVAEESYEGCFYVRLMVVDKAGVVAQIASELSKEGISIKTLTQREQKMQGAVPLVFTTHACREVVMKRVLSHLESSDFLSAKPTMLRIEY
jgi:homoserine dehydrogenase